MNTTEELASMQTVVIEKQELLKIIKENKEAHDTIFNAALSGYWDHAQSEIDKKAVEFKKAVKKLQEQGESELKRLQTDLENKEKIPDNTSLNYVFSYRNVIPVVYPENHSEDYNRAFRKIELSVYDKVKLSEGEFEQYVLNNWGWRKSFLTSNISYITGCVMPQGEFLARKGAIMYSGCSSVIGSGLANF